MTRYVARQQQSRIDVLPLLHFRHTDCVSDSLMHREYDASVPTEPTFRTNRTTSLTGPECGKHRRVKQGLAETMAFSTKRKLSVAELDGD